MVVGSDRGRTPDEVTARRNLLIAAMSLPVLLGGGRAVAQEATATVDGYVATQGSTATKSDTPLIETPQSISVITKDQMEAQAVDSLTSALRYTPGASGNLYGTDNRGHGLQMRGISNFSGVLQGRAAAQGEQFHAVHGARFLRRRTWPACSASNAPYRSFSHRRCLAA